MSSLHPAMNTGNFCSQLGDFNKRWQHREHREFLRASTIPRARLMDKSSHKWAEFSILQPTVQHARPAYSQPATEALSPKESRGHCSTKTWSYSKSNNWTHHNEVSAFSLTKLSWKLSDRLFIKILLWLVLKLQVSSCALHQISLEAWGMSTGILVKLFILLRGKSSSLLHKLIGKKKHIQNILALRLLLLI